MNLIKKAGLVLTGLAMAAAGLAFGLSGRNAVRVEATTDTSTINFASVNSPTSQFTTATAASLVAVSNDGYIKLTHTQGSGKTAANNYYPGASSRTSTRFYSGNTVAITANDATTRYLTSIVFTVGTSEGYANALAGSWTNGTGVKSGSGTAQDPYIVTITPDADATTVSRTLSATASTTSCAVTWSDTQSSSATLSLSKNSANIAKGGTTTVTATYSGLTGSLSVGTSNAGVATAALSGSDEGSRTVTITAVNVGKATITVESTADELSRTISVIVYGTSFKKVTMNSQISNGTRAIIVAYDTDESKYFAMSYGNGTSGNNRGRVQVSVSDGVATNSSADVAMVTLNYISAGTHAGQYTLQDVNHGIYFYGASGSNYLKTNATLDENDNAYYWTISLGASESTITCVGGGSRDIEYNLNSNNDGFFSTYGSTQQPVQMYVLSSDYPEPVNVSSITVADMDIVEGSSGFLFTGSYLPTNANESIGYSIKLSGEDTDLLTAEGGVNMSNGTLTLSLTAASVDVDTEITLTFTATANTISEAVTVTIKNYSKTHDRITNAANLYNGQKVIIATSTGEKAMGSSIGGTTVPSVSVPHTSGGADINGSLATEYTIWEIESGKWAFYSNGYFLGATGTSSNNLERSLTLENCCKFTITISDNVASIVASSSSRGTMQFNSTYNYFSCYASANQESLSLYTPTAETSASDARVAAGYERFFLKIGAIDVEDEGTGLCKTNNYYSLAKTAYGTLTADQIDELSVAALNRLHDWAIANGENFSVSDRAFSARVTFTSDFVKESSATTVIIIVSIVGIVAIGGYFVFRRRKEY